MQIEQIITNRQIDPHHANDLVYEWEDDLRQYFGATFSYNRGIQNERYSKYIPFVLNIVQTGKPAFTYEMCTQRHNGNNKRNIIPCVIDFYIREPWKVRLWYCTYWRNPVICVSSREVYEYLAVSLGLKKIQHLPLSISDRYRITEETEFEKSYDMLIAGRQDSMLTEFLNKYLTLHPDTTYIRRVLQDGKSVYVDQSGEVVSPTDSREIYMQMMRKSRACMYSTPGMDDKRRTNGYSQVTPRFLEIIAGGCYPLMRYKVNADTDYYRLADFGPSITSYEQFEKELDKARSEKADMRQYSRYLEGHYTSTVAKRLEEIIRAHG